MRNIDLNDFDLSPELREKAKACKTPQELLALAKAEGHKLSDAEMEAIAGGRDTLWASCSTYTPQGY